VISSIEVIYKKYMSIQGSVNYFEVNTYKGNNSIIAVILI